MRNRPPACPSLIGGLPPTHPLQLNRHQGRASFQKGGEPTELTTELRCARRHRHGGLILNGKSRNHGQWLDPYGGHLPWASRFTWLGCHAALSALPNSGYLRAPQRFDRPRRRRPHPPAGLRPLASLRSDPQPALVIPPGDGMKPVCLRKWRSAPQAPHRAGHLQPPGPW